MIILPPAFLATCLSPWDLLQWSKIRAAEMAAVGKNTIRSPEKYFLQSLAS